MESEQTAEDFFLDFIKDYMLGKISSTNSEYFTAGAFVFDSSRTTDSFDNLGISSLQISHVDCNVLAENVVNFAMTVSYEKKFHDSRHCSVSTRITSTVVHNSGCWKISSLHISVPSELLDFLDFYPLAENADKLVQVRDEFYAHSFNVDADSSKDPLTGILHRGAAKRLIDTALLTQNETPCAFLLFDLDNFKQINDSYGHMAGDEVLVRFSNLLSESFRSGDVVARLGGDEFIVFMKNASLSIVEDRARRIKERVPALAAEYGSNLSTSIGIAIPEKSGTKFEQLYFQADRALYSAKAAGKNDYSFYA
ncbi:MAG: GGDEF domain-containing protein [Spirochaetaceae bacterium]|nr:GGDEF domain-containing protein [Spirochaetaceae bacterium]